VGLHIDVRARDTCEDIVAATEAALEALLNTTAFRDARAYWVETQTLPPANSRKFLTENVTCHPDHRQRLVDAMRPIADGRVTLVRTRDILVKHERYKAEGDLHMQYCNEFRADALLNHIAPAACFPEEPDGRLGRR